MYREMLSSETKCVCGGGGDAQRNKKVGEKEIKREWKQREHSGEKEGERQREGGGGTGRYIERLYMHRE